MVLTKLQEIWIDRGAALDKQITTLTEEFAGIKKSLIDLPPGTHITKAKNHVKVSEEDKLSDIDPMEAMEVLKAKKLGSRFYACVKVTIGEIKKYLSESEVLALRVKVDVTRKYSFK